MDAAADGVTGLRRARERRYDLVVLDLLLPRLDGLAMLRELTRSMPELPVLILSARADVKTKLRGFDLGAACSGFTYALTVGWQLVSTGSVEHALIVGADVMSSIIDYTDRSTCVLFGDGAGAVVLSPAEPGEPALIDCVMQPR